MKKLSILGVIVLAVGVVAWLQPELRKEILAEVPIVGSSKTTKVYKWQDAHGNWHVTDAPPEQGRSIQTLEYTAKVNVLPLPPQLAE